MCGCQLHEQELHRQRVVVFFSLLQGLRMSLVRMLERQNHQRALARWFGEEVSSKHLPCGVAG